MRNCIRLLRVQEEKAKNVRKEVDEDEVDEKCSLDGRLPLRNPFLHAKQGMGDRSFRLLSLAGSAVGVPAGSPLPGHPVLPLPGSLDRMGRKPVQTASTAKDRWPVSEDHRKDGTRDSILSSPSNAIAIKGERSEWVIEKPH
jgi:hypothetical protein